MSLPFDSYICIEVQRRADVDNLQESEVVKYMTITPIVKKHKNSSGNHWESNLKPTLLLNLRNSDLLWLIGYFVTKLWFDINHHVHGYWWNHLLRVMPTILECRNYLETLSIPKVDMESISDREGEEDSWPACWGLEGSKQSISS